MTTSQPQLRSDHMTAEEKTHFLAQGYLHVRGVLTGDHLAHLRSEFDRVWDLEKPRVNQHQLLKYQPFINLIEHGPILGKHRSIFGDQVQLLQYDLLRQGPRSEAPERYWHRDFSFPGDRPIAINTILYLDDMTEETGPTLVVPGTHIGDASPAHAERGQSLPGEVAVHARAGDAVLINAAIWHSGGRNRGEGLRRAIYLYYGFWWLKRYESDQALPWQALAQASDQRLSLLGVRMPDPRFHMYEGHEA